MNKDLYGDDAETYTTHALGHLPEQRKLHGCPLVLLSNFVFEGFIATMKRQYHGSRGIINQMLRNVDRLQNISTVISQMEAPADITAFVRKLTNQQCRSKVIVANGCVVGTKIICMPELAVPLPIRLKTFLQGKEFYARAEVGFSLYHSLSYKRKGMSNSYSIAFWNDGRMEYGDVLFFVLDDGNCFGVVNCYEITGDTMYGEDNLGFDDGLDGIINSGTLGCMFVHVRKSDRLQIVGLENFVSKIIYVPDHEDDSGNISLVLSSYQHD